MLKRTSSISLLCLSLTLMSGPQAFAAVKLVQPVIAPPGVTAFFKKDQSSCPTGTVPYSGSQQPTSDIFWCTNVVTAPPVSKPAATAVSQPTYAPPTPAAPPVQASLAKTLNTNTATTVQTPSVLAHPSTTVTAPAKAASVQVLQSQHPAQQQQNQLLRHTTPAQPAE